MAGTEGRAPVDAEKARRNGTGACGERYGSSGREDDEFTEKSPPVSVLLRCVSLSKGSSM